MIESPFLSFLDIHNRVPTDDEFKRLCARRGLSSQQEALGMIDLLSAQGVFESPMGPTERQLLATLTRTAGFRPRLAVDNTRRNAAARSIAL